MKEEYLHTDQCRNNSGKIWYGKKGNGFLH